MIIHRKKNVKAIYRLSKAVIMIYQYGKMVYQAIRSCFGTGVWKSDKPWVGDDKWKSNK